MVRLEAGQGMIADRKTFRMRMAVESGVCSKGKTKNRGEE